ncbi:hypothetical protein F5972_05345 [Microbispora cellulosiformans]|uniref:Uncharacterized protein n=1 Tax=Microbispora cellulosiformans TaxID=2614688 RepID=A0A5J5K702_9ACTN|nr:hypothetical protein [Microbispora cellulosiformans]KAA9380560.1 hypothetical protein F5972_05345 [Microbispora cellulosiformans]
MSEVVPLPSFGEVFFDARGQDRVLRVTWHDGTLVLSLWRGEMCTASFRMPMDDVGRLIDTLDDGYTEADVPDQDAGTGPFPRQAPDQDGYAAGREGYPPHAAPLQEHGQEQAREARGRDAYPAQDPYTAPDPYATQAQDAYPAHDPYAAQVRDAYGAPAQDAYPVQDAYPAPDPYAVPARDAYPAQAADPYAAPAQDAYAAQAQDGYATPPDGYAAGLPGQAADGYAPRDPYTADDPYAAPQHSYGQAQDGYGAAHDAYARGENGYAAPDTHRGHEAGYPEQPARGDYRGGYQGTYEGDYQGDYEYPDFPGTGQYARPPVPPPAPAADAHPAPAALGPNDVLVARGTPTQDRLVASSATQTGPLADPRQQPPAVDPNDPLGLGAVRPYVNEPPLYHTGERLRPDQWPADQAPGPHTEHERPGRRRSGRATGESQAQWPDDGQETWEDARGW